MIVPKGQRSPATPPPAPQGQRRPPAPPRAKHEVARRLLAKLIRDADLYSPAVGADGTPSVLIEADVELDDDEVRLLAELFDEVLAQELDHG